MIFDIGRRDISRVELMPCHDDDIADAYASPDYWSRPHMRTIITPSIIFIAYRIAATAFATLHSPAISHQAARQKDAHTRHSSPARRMIAVQR